MVSTFTPNIQLEEPARGDDVGTWDTPVNSNMTLIDKVVGAVATISLNNAPVVLSVAQYQSKTIIFNSTLTGNVAITFPSSFFKTWEIVNLCTGSSAFVITFGTTNPGVNGIGVKPGDPFDVIFDGSQFRYKNLGNIGAYWDYGGSSTPAWVSNCAIPPFLLCDGSVFSAVTYPQLFNILGTTTLPDFRGRTAFQLNGGTGRLTSAGAGIDGNTRFAGGGTNGITLNAVHIPTLTSINGAQAITVQSQAAGGRINIPVTAGVVTNSGNSVGTATPGGIAVPYTTAGGGDWTGVASLSANNAISVTYTNGAQQIVNSPSPGVVAGIRLIRAA